MNYATDPSVPNRVSDVPTGTTVRTRTGLYALPMGSVGVVVRPHAQHHDAVWALFGAERRLIKASDLDVVDAACEDRCGSQRHYGPCAAPNLPTLACVCGAPVGVLCLPWCTEDEATRFTAEDEDAPAHVNYPHHPGHLYDCPGCEDGPCVCAGDASVAPCVSHACERSE